MSFGLAGALARRPIASATCSTRRASSTSAARRCGKARPLGVAGAHAATMLGTRRARARRGGAPQAARVRAARTRSTWRAACSRGAAGSPASCARSPTAPTSAIEGVDTTVHPTGAPTSSGCCAGSRRAAVTRCARCATPSRRCARSRRRCRMSGRVLLAAPRSFCAGVDRAIEIVERLLEQHGAPVYVRHQIVHNEHVVRRLEELGAVFVEDESEIPAGEYLRPLRARRRAGGEGERRAARPARRRRDVPAREQGARRGAPLRRQRPSRRARRPREPRRGDRHARRAAGLDRRDRVARAGTRR